MAYFAQFDLDVPCVAMVTASHNDNGWTGVKMGANRPLTFGPDEMTRLKEIVLGAEFKQQGRRLLSVHENFPARYIADLTKRPKLKRKLKVVVRLRQRHRRRVRAAGAGGDRLRGGAARHRARLHLSEIQSESRRHEDAARDARRGAAHKADVGLGFDGDGDRCGVVDNTGEEIFADKVGVMLARDMSAITGRAPSWST
jgi:phosphomannomutase/phosphoglucomutase